MEDRVSISVTGHIADVRLNRPDKLNALDLPMFTAIAGAVAQVREMAGVRAVILSGEGRGFCAGLDMAAMASGAADLLAGPRDADGANLAQRVAVGWRSLPMPVIAALHGMVLGGGLQIAAGADIRIAAPGTRLSIREAHWGLVPDMGGNALWQGQVRSDVLRELSYTAREFGADEAVAHGFVTRLADDPHAAAMALATEIAARSPSAVRGIKRLLGEAANADTAAILRHETEEQIALLGKHEQIEQVAANMTKRAAVFGD